MREEQQKRNDGDAASESGPRDPLQSSSEDLGRISATPAIAPTRKPIRKFLWRIANALKLFVWGFRYPDLMRESYLKCMSSLFELMMKAATAHRPMMSRLALVHMDEQHEVLSIWVGVGAAAHPMRRIEELLKENEALRWQLSQSVSDRSGTPQAGNPAEEYSGERDGDEGAGTPNHPQ